MNLESEIFGIVAELKDQYGKMIPMSDYLNAAVKIQQNRVLLDCFGVNGAGPAFLEAIAMQLGYDKNYKSSITSALGDIANSISEK